MKRTKIFVSTLVLSLLVSIPTLAAWKQDNKGWWYENANGSYPINAWKELRDKWYYFDSSGYMVSSRWIGNYYLGKDGAMLVNATTPDGYQVGSDGVWIQKSGFSENEKSFWNDVIKAHYYSIQGSKIYDVNSVDTFAGVLITGNNNLRNNVFPSQDYYIKVPIQKYTNLIINTLGNEAASNYETWWGRENGYVLVPHGDFGQSAPEASITQVTELGDGRVKISGYARDIEYHPMVINDSKNFTAYLIPVSGQEFSGYQLQQISYN